VDPSTRSVQSAIQDQQVLLILQGQAIREYVTDGFRLVPRRFYPQYGRILLDCPPSLDDDFYKVQTPQGLVYYRWREEAAN
jgi:hypothetical protein